jgi:hypothetical protein
MTTRITFCFGENITTKISTQTVLYFGGKDDDTNYILFWGKYNKQKLLYVLGKDSNTKLLCVLGKDSNTNYFMVWGKDNNTNYFIFVINMIKRNTLCFGAKIATLNTFVCNS